MSLGQLILSMPYCGPWIGQRRVFSFPSQEDPVSYLAVNFSHPTWLVKHWLEAFGFEKTLALCESNNQIPPYTIRVNTLKISRQQLLERLKSKALALEATTYSSFGIRIEGPKRPLILDELYRQGNFQIQDEASQLIAPILGSPTGREDLGSLCRGRWESRSFGPIDE